MRLREGKSAKFCRIRDIAYIQAAAGGTVLSSVYRPLDAAPVILLSQFAADFSSTKLVDVTDPESVEVFLEGAPGIFTLVQQVR